MSLINLHYKKIAKAYAHEFLHPRFSVKIIREPVSWFLKKNGSVLTLNTELQKTVEIISPQEAVNFIDCLIVSCMHYAKECGEQILIVTPETALEAIKAPFYNKDVSKFIRNYLAYTPKENYRNLELSDDVASRIYTYNMEY